MCSDSSDEGEQELQTDIYRGPLVHFGSFAACPFGAWRLAVCRLAVWSLALGRLPLSRLELGAWPFAA